MAGNIRVIEVIPYNAEWKNEFEKIKIKINGIIGDLVIRIEHVGSTSVEGLFAKPIIDIDVVISNYDCLPEIIKRLTKVGYQHEGDLGVEGREAFSRAFKDDFMEYHLYVCPKDGKGYLEHIAFRDYLRNNEVARNEYGVLKCKLAETYCFDRDGYCNAKTDFVRDILKKSIYR
ncbi:GrpB family protein [Clostridium lacusfryxellense]|uniref:GrpB family protein n=1 Tax=Clostridium lacusfryxellense TaxID=205328 RepID=UPI001C0A9937|nr:GrpB family protein [Clostridium lacusfryxellense]MBU3113076.1 GrpB family protein [Clostridium lacusfryxellense]